MNKYLVVKDGKEYTVQAEIIEPYEPSDNKIDFFSYPDGRETQVAHFKNVDFWSKIVE